MFNPVIVRNSLVNEISSSVPLILKKGPSTSTYEQVNATSANTSSITWTVTPPSDETIIDRQVTVESDLMFKVVITNVTAGQTAFSYGVTDSFQKFPFNQLLENVNFKMNSQSTILQTREIMTPLLTMYKDSDFNQYDTPHMSDTFIAYEQASLTNASVLSNRTNGMRDTVPPRGSYDVVIGTCEHRNAAGALLDALFVSANVTDTFTFTLSIKTTEPLLFLSPFLFSDSHGDAGMYGINQFTLTCALNNQCNNILCSSNDWTHTVSLTNVELAKHKLNMHYVTPQPDEILGLQNSLNHVTYDRYMFNDSQIMAANTTTDVTTNSFVLQTIPNRIIVCVREPLNAKKTSDTASFYSIEKISIHFQNIQSILVNAGQNQLYQLSKKNGSKQSWLDFKGNCRGNAGAKVGTVGSVLVISSEDLNLPSYLTNGSVGSYTISMRITIRNNKSTATTNQEVMIIPEYQGVVSFNSGKTEYSQGIGKQDVTSATGEQHGLSDSFVKQFSSDASFSSGSLKQLPMAPSLSGGAKSGGAYSGGMSSINSNNAMFKHAFH
jgi:hypothetical protein